MPQRNRAREQRRAAAPPLGEQDVPTRARPPADVVAVDTPEAARELAVRLLTPGRRWPVAVVSTAADADGPYVDTGELKSEVGDLAEVALVRTGDPSWAFSAAMPPQTQVYGGASRVYPVDHAWVGQPRRSRLRFAYSDADGARVRADLVHDVLGAALQAGLIGAPDLAPAAAVVEGIVRRVLGQRALVDLDDGGQATVAEELTGAGVPLAQVLAPGLRVHGVLDPTSRLLDVGAHLPDDAASEHLARTAYRDGDVVLVRVREASADAVTVELAPRHASRVPRAHVTTNELDHLDDLFEPGEVVLARTVVGPAGLTVRLDDVDETEDVPVPALALLPGGPPWLLPPVATGRRAPEPVAPEPTPRPTPPLSPSPAAEPASATAYVPAETTGPADLTEPVEAAVPAEAAPVRPTPALLSHGPTHRPPQPPPAPTPAPPATPAGPAPKGKALQDAQLALAAAVTRAETAERDATTSGRLAQQLRSENEQLLLEVHELEARITRLERSLGEQKRKYRQADLRRQQAESRTPTSDDDGPWFTDPADQFRHEVRTAWVRGVPAAQKASLPLRDYSLGPRFLDSLTLGGISRRKIVETVVHVVTGRAADINGLQLHRLRTDEGGDSQPVTRDADGATCFRVSLQINTPSARRLHFWRLPDGGYELSRVVLHDDVEP
ncbi:hypothetical protein [Isoptericola dokdonensis]|uniref:S1 motif domain-containing protein n=1 Tax=Isoptericola dokdonensis DS-3 TaxID=1300344 RepID=A0A161HS08_9MICO|nr:hypothetical protein [Isoptericola dokdonensis]ANC32162.1 hypothetical protein I598_2632 [Isoptericola dokdonensis DS-3]